MVSEITDLISAQRAYEMNSKVIKTADENGQCLAARGLVLDGKGEQAADVLQKLTACPDQATSCLARMSLLGLGRTEQLAPLAKVNGRLRKVAFSVMALPYSDATFVMAFENECTEPF